ncbi:MAG: ACT domain-containing protein [Chloroflexia bacterium]
MSKIQIGGIIKTTNLALIQVLGLPPTTQAAARLMAALGAEGISASALVQCRDYAGGYSLALTVAQDRREQALRIVRRAATALQARAVEEHSPVALVAVYGPHFSDRPAIAGEMFSALARAGIEVRMITTSISTVAGVIAAEDLERAEAVLKETFLLPP